MRWCVRGTHLIERHPAEEGMLNPGPPFNTAHDFSPRTIITHTGDCTNGVRSYSMGLVLSIDKEEKEEQTTRGGEEA